MKFVVLGAGAIGAYVGAGLARGGADVTLIARGEHLRAMQERGVRVLSPRGDFEAHPAATDDWDAIRDADTVVLGLKAYSLPEAASRLGGLLKPGACVVAAQNGIPWWFFQRFGGALEGTTLQSVDPGGVIAASIPAGAVVGAIVYISTEIVEPGVVRQTEGTRLAIGEPDGSVSERCAQIAAALEAGGLKCNVDERLRENLWVKLIGNAAFNPVSALTRATMRQFGDEPEMVELLRAALAEGAAVGEAVGLELPVSVDRRLERGIAVGDHKTSMLQDLDAGKPLELDCITGAVIEVAANVGVAVPHLESIYACTKLLDTVLRGAPVSVAS
jgi:2-dehydropantoate 2-reductase